MRYATLPPRPEGVEVHHYASDSEWANGIRRRDITASRAAVLFSGQLEPSVFTRVEGLEHPYQTLQGVARELVEPARRKQVSRGNAYTLAGSVLEPAVAEYLRHERPGWKVQRLHGVGERVYLRDPRCRLGATPEPWLVEIDGETWSPEFKTASYKEFGAKGWERGVPGWIYVQGAVACGLAGTAGCVVVCMQRSGYGLGSLAIHMFPRKRLLGLYREVRNRAAALARRVDVVRRSNASVAARKGVR